MRLSMLVLVWHIWTQCNSQQVVLGLDLLDLLHVLKAEDENDVFARNVQSLKVDLEFQDFGVKGNRERRLICFCVEHSQLPLLLNLLFPLGFFKFLLSYFFS